MIWKKYILYLVGLLILCLNKDCSTKLIEEMTKSNYEKLIRNTKPWFILYTKDECAECKMAYERMLEISKKLNQNDVSFGVVDCTKTPEICSRFNHFPSFDTIRKGHNVIYKGGIKYEELLGHILEIAQPAVKNAIDKLENQSFEKLLDQYQAFVLFSLKEIKVSDLNTLEEFVASIYDYGLYMYIDWDETHQIEDQKLRETLLEIQKTSEKATIVFRKGMEGYAVYDPSKDLAFTSFIFKNLFEAVPNVGKFYKFEQVVRNFKYILLYLPSSEEFKKEKQTGEEIPPEERILNLLGDLVLKYSDVLFLWHEYQELYISKFGLKRDALPSFVIIDIAKNNIYIYPSDLDPLYITDVDSWIHEVIEKERQPLKEREKTKILLWEAFKNRPLIYIYTLLRFEFYNAFSKIISIFRPQILRFQSTHVYIFLKRHQKYLKIVRAILLLSIFASFTYPFIKKTFRKKLK